jgi:GH25 family lysozyme M1 (1,4-beta-N-acetylmuramidase)
MLRGIDVAGVNDLRTVFAALGSAQFVGVKATEGAGWNDPNHARIVAEARRRGVKVMHYHFAWAEHSPVTEAIHFLSVAQPKPGDLVALDLERYSAISWSQRLAYALAWLDYVKAHTKCSPVIYLNESWINGLRSAASVSQWKRLTSYPLWYAEPTGTPGRFNRQPGWPVWTFHQFGIVGGLDADVLNGSFAVWNALAVPAPAKPKVPTKVVVGVGVILAGGIGAVAGHQSAPPPKPTPPVCPAVRIIDTN